MGEGRSSWRWVTSVTGWTADRRVALTLVPPAVVPPVAGIEGERVSRSHPRQWAVDDGHERPDPELVTAHGRGRMDVYWDWRRILGRRKK